VARIPGSRVALYAHEAGWTGWRLIVAVAIAKGESGWNTSAHALTSREDSRGLWQINVNAHPWGKNINLYNGEINGRAAYRVWREAGGSFHPWSVYIHCTYGRYIDDAIQAVRDYGIGRSLEAEIAAAAHAKSQGCGVDTGIVSAAVGQLTDALQHTVVIGLGHEEWLSYTNRGIRRGRTRVRHYGGAAWNAVKRRI